MDNSEDIPVYKVGAVVVRNLDTHPEFLLVKPIGKQGDGKVPWVLPRGTLRAYDDASRDWVDLRDEITISELKDAPREQYDDAILHELNEEAGMTGLTTGDLIPIGVKIYQKSADEQMPVYWFAVNMDKTPHVAFSDTPSDATEPARWVDLNEMTALANKGQARHGYVEICKDVLEELRGKTVER